MRGNSLIKFAREGVGSRKTECYKDDIHLSWKLSDNIVIALCFDCHGRVLSVWCLCFPLCVSLKLIGSCKEIHMLKTRT